MIKTKLGMIVIGALYKLTVCLLKKSLDRNSIRLSVNISKIKLKINLPSGIFLFLYESNI